MQTYQDSGGFGGGIAFPSLTPVVKRLLIVLLGIWGGLFVLFLVAEPLLNVLLTWLGVTPSLWFSGFPWVFPWQVLSYGFLHSPGEPLHVLFNCLLIYFFGTQLEGTLGSRRFLGFYLSAVVAAGLASLLIDPLLGPTGRVFGASGAGMALLCAAATMRPQATVILFFFPVPIVWLALGLVGIDVVRLLLDVAGKSGPGGVAYIAHLGGAAFGFVAVRRGLIWRDWWEEVESRRRDRERRSVAADEAKLDELLQRIHERGLQSLSEREKAFLKRMSKRG